MRKVLFFMMLLLILAGCSMDGVKETNTEQLAVNNDELNGQFKVVGLNNIKQLACGENHSLALQNDGDLYVTGNNEFGQLGLGDTINRDEWIKVDLSGVNYIASGKTHSIAITTNGDCFVTGRNNYGQLGLGDNIDRNDFTEISQNNVASAAAGMANTLILTESGYVYATGSNCYGQLGNGNNTDRNTFMLVYSQGAKKIACGAYHSILIKNDANSRIYVTGLNNYGQLGLNNTTNKNSFTQSTTGAFEKIACGYYHSLILKSDGRLYVCGRNNYGQLGLGNNVDKLDWTASTTNPVLEIHDIAGGCFHSLIKVDRNYYDSVFVTGRNNHGQLGLGNNEDINEWQVSLSSVIIMIAAGQYHSLTTTGVYNGTSIQAAGYNYYGQLGRGVNHGDREYWQ